MLPQVFFGGAGGGEQKRERERCSTAREIMLVPSCVCFFSFFSNLELLLGWQSSGEEEDEGSASRVEEGCEVY